MHTLLRVTGVLSGVELSVVLETGSLLIPKVGPDLPIESSVVVNLEKTCTRTLSTKLFSARRRLNRRLVLDTKVW